MSILRRLCLLFLCAGLWCIVDIPSCQAADAQIHSQSKALAHYIMAVIHDLNGRSQEAAIEYQKSSRINPRQARPHLKLGAYYTRAGLIKKAVKELNLAVKWDPSSIQAHYLLALIYSSQRKYDLATSEYELILKQASFSNPANVEVHDYLAQLYFAMHQYSKAADQLASILKIHPQNTSALYLLGCVYAQGGQLDSAKQYFRQTLSIEPDHDEALNSLAYIYAQEGEHLDVALRMVKRAISQDPTNGAFYDTLGWVLFKKGFYAESLLALEKAKGFIEDPTIYEHMGDVYQAVNESALARKFWLKSLSLDPDQKLLTQKMEQLNKSSAQAKQWQHTPNK